MLTHTMPIETLHTKVLKFINGRLRKALPKRAIERVKRCKRSGVAYQWAISLRSLLKCISKKTGFSTELMHMTLCATRLIESLGPMVGYSDGDSTTDEDI